jgi:U3 small nucleolar RNA-associated protein 14
VRKGFKSIFPKPGDPEESDSSFETDSNNEEAMETEEKPELATKTLSFAPCKEIDLRPKAIAERKSKSLTINPDNFYVDSSTHSAPRLAAAIEDISEAFADDDVMQDFTREIEETERKKNKPDVGGVGWGSWFGPGMDEKEEETPPAIFTADKMPHVVFSTESNFKLAEHQVRDIPYGFTSAEQYERTLRQPVGRDFNTESSFKKMITPRVKTRAGVAIAPMSKEQVNPDDYVTDTQDLVKL